MSFFTTLTNKKLEFCGPSGLDVEFRFESLISFDRGNKSATPNYNESKVNVSVDGSVAALLPSA